MPSKGATSIEPRSVPGVLVDFIRWSIVLRALELHATGGKLDRLTEFVDALGRHALFPASPARAQPTRTPGTMLRLDKAMWGTLTGVAPKRKSARDGNEGSGPRSESVRLESIASAYECRAFYGLQNPNNLSVRLAELAAAQSQEERNSRAPSEGDGHIHSWGEYAVELVARNGGWEGFAALQSLDHLTDVRCVGESREVRGGDSDSLVVRVLALFSSRYVQLLLSPVGLMWPLWTLQNDLSNRLLNADPALVPSDEPKREESLVDVSTTIGDRLGFPHPFSFAAKAVLEAESSSNDARRTDPQEAWTPETLKPVAQALREDAYVPPVLLAMREDQWMREEKLLPRGRGLSRLLLVIQRCEAFASYFVGKAPATKKWRVAYEKASWGTLVCQGVPETDQRALTRAEIAHASDSIDAEIVLSHFPADILLRSSKKFTQYTALSIPGAKPQRSGLHTMPMPYIVPGVALWGGRLLSQQPRTAELLMDLGRRMYAIERALNDILPPRLPTNDGANRAETAKQFEQYCRHAEWSARGREGGNVPFDPNKHSVLESVAREVGALMIERVFTGEERRKALAAMAVWGWVELVQLARFVRIDYSAEFVHGGIIR